MFNFRIWNVFFSDWRITCFFLGNFLRLKYFNGFQGLFLIRSLWVFFIDMYHNLWSFLLSMLLDYFLQMRVMRSNWTSNNWKFAYYLPHFLILFQLLHIKSLICFQKLLITSQIIRSQFSGFLTSKWIRLVFFSGKLGFFCIIYLLFRRFEMISLWLFVSLLGISKKFFSKNGCMFWSQRHHRTF